MIDLKKIVFYTLGLLSFFAVEALSIDYISNSISTYFITAIVWAVMVFIVINTFNHFKNKFLLRNSVITDRTQSFSIALDFDGKHYEGTVFPSYDKNKKGFPIYFRIDFGPTFFAAIKNEKSQWVRKGGKKIKRPGEEKLIQDIGDIIMAHYHTVNT
jgi:hypothetical protein